MHYDVIVIGGGSAGLMAAISAAETGAKTLLLEKGKKLGTKLLISGGGRCNVTNRLPEDEVLKNIPGNGKFLYSAFSIFNNYDIIDYFESMGVALKEEDHGRMFPVSNSAKSVVDTLLQKMEALRVEIRLSSPVQALDYGENKHTVILEDGEKITARAIVIAVGGKSVPHTGSTGDGYAWAKKAGHTITDLYPTEVALTSSDTVVQEKALQGLSLRDVAVTVLNKNGKSIVTHQMDMVFTHFGVSGPAILRCSQFVVKELMYQKQKQVRLSIDLVPEVHQEKLYEALLAAMEDQALKSFKNIVKSILDVPERLLLHILNKSGITDDIRATNISKEKTRLFVNIVKGFIIHIDGSLSIQKAFVTGGGIATKEIIPSTMASKVMENLFFCGEILDIHGYTGGYNITAAFVTGRLAGTNAAYASMA